MEKPIKSPTDAKEFVGKTISTYARIASGEAANAAVGRMYLIGHTGTIEFAAHAATLPEAAVNLYAAVRLLQECEGEIPYRRLVRILIEKANGDKTNYFGHSHSERARGVITRRRLQIAERILVYASDLSEER